MVQRRQKSEEESSKINVIPLTKVWKKQFALFIGTGRHSRCKKLEGGEGVLRGRGRSVKGQKNKGEDEISKKKVDDRGLSTGGGKRGYWATNSEKNLRTI